MTMTAERKTKNPPKLREECPAVEHLREAILSGKHWYLALLETIGLWTLPEEKYKGRTYRYLIANEAFDWLLLAERLCDAVNAFIPEQEKIDLLFFGKAPLELSNREFKQLIGCAKYRAFLNYWYGVAVEEALILAVEKEIEKEHRSCPYASSHDFSDLAYQRIYGASQQEMLHRFRSEAGRPDSNRMELSELKEFTYWLFKHRLNYCDKARVASDTRKALIELAQHFAARRAREEARQEKNSQVIPL